MASAWSQAGFAFYARRRRFLWGRHTFYKIGYDLSNPA
jgi:hypothetical protein